jgi:hypothetical protein
LNHEVNREQEANAQISQRGATVNGAGAGTESGAAEEESVTAGS